MTGSQTMQGLIDAGLKHHQAGNLDEAERTFQNVLNIQPHNIRVLHAMALLARQKGQPDTANQYLSQAIKAAPKVADLHFLSGLWKQQDGQLDDAVQCYKKVLSLEPKHLQALTNLGVAYIDQQQPDRAIPCFQSVLLKQPNHLNALNNLGNAWKMLQRLEDAITCYQKALQLDATCADIWDNLGLALVDADRLDESLPCFTKSIELNPQCGQTWINLGLVYAIKNDLPNALDCYQTAMQLNPNDAQVYRHLGRLLQDHGECDGAQEGYRTACMLEPSRLDWQLQAETLCPIIPQSRAQIEAIRRQILQTLDTLETFNTQTLNIHPDELDKSSLEPSFYLPYQGLDDLEIKSRYADWLAHRLPNLIDVPPVKCNVNASRPKVGFVISPKHEDIFMKLMGSLAALLPANLLEPWLISREKSFDYLQANIPNSKNLQYLALPVTISDAVRTIRTAEFDIMMFFEVGTDSMNYFLPLYRLAPIQCTTWGFPVTTGLPTMDYYISSHWLENEAHQQYYREKLVLLPSLPTYYPRPKLPETLYSRAHFGLPETANLYSCLQNLFKLHPDMDTIFTDILQRDPNGEILLLEGHQAGWTQLLLERLQQQIPPHGFARIRVMPRMSRDEFISLQAVSDVILDPVHFGGGNTALEGFAVGTPIITLPMEFLRSRVTLGCYQKMGLTEGIAETRDQYVDLAIQFATDSNARQSFKAKILDRNSVLFEDAQAVQDMATFFLQAVADYQTPSHQSI